MSEDARVTTRPLLTARAFAKVNLSLEVGPLRADAYHELETIFQTIDLADELVVEPADGLALEVEGDAPAGPENLVLRAAELLAREGGVAPRARLLLKKRIPAGGGLGGGSSDAAAALLALDELWGLRAGPASLFALAATIGSDVPFFLLGGTALGLGRGERLYAIAELPERPIVLALPGVPVSTKEAFRALDTHRRLIQEGPYEAVGYPSMWAWDAGVFRGLRNDLEPPVFAQRPELSRLRNALHAAGALHARMSGSGSTLYGLFGDDETARHGLAAVEALGVRGLVARTLNRRSLEDARQSSRSR